MAGLARWDPGALLGAATALVARLGAGEGSNRNCGDGGEDFQLFRCTEEVLAHVLPHLRRRGGSGGEVGATVGGLLKGLVATAEASAAPPSCPPWAPRCCPPSSR